MARPISRVELNETERVELERRANAATASKRDSLRATIVLHRANGLKQTQVAEMLGVSAACVNKWSQRFDLLGLAGLKDKAGRGRPRTITDRQIEQVLTRATQPPKPCKRWSVRKMAKEVGISPDSVHRIWRQNDIKPHL